MKTSKIFLSYSHRDENWKDQLITHLGVLHKEGLLDLWDDRIISAGEKWQKGVANALNRADIAMLLISANFLVSDYILKSEIPSLLEKRRNEGLVVVPVILRPCAWFKIPWLAQLQVLPKAGKPISSYENPDVPLAEIAERISELIEIVSLKKETSAKLVEDVPFTNRRDKSKDILFLLNILYDTHALSLHSMRVRVIFFNCIFTHCRAPVYRGEKGIISKVKETGEAEERAENIPKKGEQKNKISRRIYIRQRGEE